MNDALLGDPSPVSARLLPFYSGVDAGFSDPPSEPQLERGRSTQIYEACPFTFPSLVLLIHILHIGRGLNVPCDFRILINLQPHWTAGIVFTAPCTLPFLTLPTQ